jgi:hypothetical protein
VHPGPYPYSPPPAYERVRVAWQDRPNSDYVFDFWTALGWTVLTCGVYGIYVNYQLMRRMRDHNRRRLKLLDAATTFAWERATAEGLADELRPGFERIATRMTALRQLSGEFRDPGIWLILFIISSGIATYVAYYLLDRDLITHDDAEGGIESELAAIYRRLGQHVPDPDPSRRKGPHNIAGRIVALIFSFGIYGIFWLNDMMKEPNQHFAHNWAWEDPLVNAVQALGTAA